MKRIFSGSPFERDIGYSRAVIDDPYIFVSGTTGFDYSTMTISNDVVEQAQQCCKNISDVLIQAGSSLDHVVRVMYLMPRIEDFEPCWPVLRHAFGNAKPAATFLRADLLDSRMLIEIQVTARIAASVPQPHQ